MSFITAVLVYVGASSADGTYQFFGLEYYVLDLTVQDYVLRISDLAIKLLAGALFTVVLLALVHLALIRLLPRWPGATRALCLAMIAAGLVLLLIGGERFFREENTLEIPLIPARLVTPTALGLGLLLSVYALYLYSLMTDRPVWPETVSPVIRTVGRTAFTGFLILMLLWWTAAYAEDQGPAEATAMVMERPRELPRVVVFSPERLHLEGPGVTETRLPERPGEPARYRYRYDGLRLLLHTNRQYFLIPLCWRQNNGARTIALGEDPSLRLEFLRLSRGRAAHLERVRGGPECPSS